VSIYDRTTPTAAAAARLDAVTQLQQRQQYAFTLYRAGVSGRSRSETAER